MDKKTRIAAIVADLGARFIGLSDEIWDRPEMRWAEHFAVERQRALAVEYGFRVQDRVGGLPTAFSAEYGHGGPVIAILGEYDALEGLSQAPGATTPMPDPHNLTTFGHGCGHHLLGAGSLLAAVTVARYLDATGQEGRVRYYGCPAEEAAAGKSFMVRAGAFDDVAAALTWHPTGYFTARQWHSLAYVQARFAFSGTAAHAGVSPHLGRSALDAVELMNVGVNFLREHMPASARIHYAITDSGGTSPNVVQAKSTVYYIVRAETTAEVRDLYRRVTDIAEGAALMTGTTVDVIPDGASAELLPNDALERLLQSNVELFGPIGFTQQDQELADRYTTSLPEELIAAHRSSGTATHAIAESLQTNVPFLDTARPRELVFGSTDVGDVSWVTPTAQVMVQAWASGTPMHSWQAVAQGKLPAAHASLLHAARIVAASAVDLLESSDLVDAARAELSERTSEAPYVSPIPEGTVPPPLREAAERP
ncbi:amidohydrolase [Microbacterium sp. No. 7]|uniref:amidohydrolase n=1 Tax=Microbacterium sp. No. 7 TaxID=1714373 RepID=UPI0006D063B7|nr:amidohydrolase [Microbacterium sp. No. 7]